MEENITNDSSEKSLATQNSMERRSKIRNVATSIYDIGGIMNSKFTSALGSTDTTYEPKYSHKINLSRELIIKLKEPFKELTGSNVDAINIDCIRIFFKALGYYEKKEEVNNFIQDLDPNQTGVLNFDRFVTFIHLVLNKPESVNEITKGFMMIDRENKGYIDYDDVREANKEFKLGLENEEIEEMIDDVAESETKRVNLKEFIKTINSTAKYFL